MNFADFENSLSLVLSDEQNKSNLCRCFENYLCSELRLVSAMPHSWLYQCANVNVYGEQIVAAALANSSPPKGCPYLAETHNRHASNIGPAIILAQQHTRPIAFIMYTVGCPTWNQFSSLQNSLLLAAHHAELLALPKVMATYGIQPAGSSAFVYCSP
eukprot:scaffold67330_cov19-Prasinocladus_malaysianus.AAC.1